MLKCTINNLELEVKPGTTIIQAMTENAQRIAHYCWHPGLSIAGVCRLCMVEIQGNPRVQIACNTVITEGMVINNTSEKVKEAVKWGLDFHLINHPLDCPVCDQAGECGLQEQYMEYGQYDSEMAEKKQKKHKVVDLGPTVVLDSERCILCSRCVRFTDEVSKTHELGLFNRGDHAEIGTHAGKKLDNKYSLNTVDICPVGALTSKDFRFKQRVWFLKDAETVCNGCSTGCNVKMFFNKEGLFRVKPVYNPEVNGHWMCDEGRDTYKFVNVGHRLTKAFKSANGAWLDSDIHPGAAAKDVAQQLKLTKSDELALVLTGQHTVEEYESIVGMFVNTFKSKNIFHWVNNVDSIDTFDGLLLRGDKNPNTMGLISILKKYGIVNKWSDLAEGIKSKKYKTLVVAGPENTFVYPDLPEKIELFVQAENLIYLSSALIPTLCEYKGKSQVTLIPLKTFVEKSGTFINFAGRVQKFKKVTTVVSEALTLSEAAVLMAGENISLAVVSEADLLTAENKRPDQVALEHRKKNEFLFNRGPL